MLDIRLKALKKKARELALKRIVDLGLQLC
jgi:hypothetical protein